MRSAADTLKSVVLELGGKNALLVYDADLKKAAAGAIALRVDVGPDGKVKTATIASSKLPDLNTATLEAVKKWSFKPGNRSIRVIVTYSLQ